MNTWLNPLNIAIWTDGVADAEPDVELGDLFIN